MFELIINAGSGEQKAEEKLAAIQAAFKKHDLNLTKVHRVQKGSDLPKIAKDAVATGGDNIVVSGGDGTISGVATHLCETKKNLAVIPSGTFNYFARNLNIPAEVDEAVAILKHGRVRPINVGKVNHLYFLNNASIGLYPRILKVRESDYKKWGRSQLIAYYSILSTLLQPQPSIGMKIMVDDESILRRSPFIFLANNGFQLENLGIPGIECVQKNALSVFVSRRHKVAAMFKNLFLLATRRLTQAKQFELFCAREMLIEVSKHDLKVAIDGEIHTLKAPLDFAIKKDALNVWVPQTAAS